MRFVTNGNSYIGAFIRVDYFTKTMQETVTREFENIFFTDSNGLPMTSEQSLFRQQLTLHEDMEEYSVETNQNQFIAVGTPSALGDFYLVALILKAELFSGLSKITLIGVVSSLCLSIALGGFLKSLSQRISRPVTKIADAMKMAGGGQLNQELLLGNSFQEFQTISTQFNAMVREISRLKIDIYEEKLVKQQVELKFLQLQANPHFYMNSLNVIYSLVMTQNYDLIKTLVLALVKHARYTLKNNTQTVKISEEMAFMENYIEIQRIRYRYELAVEVDAEPGVLEVMIPPLIIQTFVENSIKYAVEEGRLVSIRIQLKSAFKEGKPCVYICIEDDGPGYPEEILSTILHGEVYLDAQGQEHYGISNALHRFWLMYQMVDSILLDNHPSGGARTRIWVPVEAR